MRHRHATGTDRRGFIKDMGVAILTVQLLPAIAQASQGPHGGAPYSGKTLIIRSSLGFVPHTHDLWIPFAVLRAPPRQGVNLVSTQALGHAHEIALTHDQLALVNHGGAVAIKGGSHTFMIALNRAISDRTTARENPWRSA